MKASEVRQNAIDASLEEIEKVEAEILKASNEGKATVTATIPFEKQGAIEAYFKDNGFEVSLFGYSDPVELTVTWL